MFGNARFRNSCFAHVAARNRSFDWNVPKQEFGNEETNEETAYLNMDSEPAQPVQFFRTNCTGADGPTIMSRSVAIAATGHGQLQFGGQGAKLAGASRLPAWILNFDCS
jgi:hypothetical protein